MARVNKWSKHVTETSDAMDVAQGTFKQKSAAKIAHDVERDAERSSRRKSSPYRSAMSMLTFYINRAGKNLSAEQRETLMRAKDILRDEFGEDGSGKKRAAKKRTPAKKTSAKTTSAKKSTA